MKDMWYSGCSKMVSDEKTEMEKDHVDRMTNKSLPKINKNKNPNTSRPPERPPRRWHESWALAFQVLKKALLKSQDSLVTFEEVFLFIEEAEQEEEKEEE